MRLIDLRCNDCLEDVQVKCDGDNAMYCPECYSIDNFKEIEDECE